MITIIDYAKRTNAEGKDFFALILQGGIEWVQSKKTEQFYATARKASITTTFNESTCKSLIGTQLGGKIEQVKTEPYDYKIEQTGETVTLDYKWQFVPEQVEKEVFETN